MYLKNHSVYIKVLLLNLERIKIEIFFETIVVTYYIIVTPKNHNNYQFKLYLMYNIQIYYCNIAYFSFA